MSSWLIIKMGRFTQIHIVVKQGPGPHDGWNEEFDCFDLNEDKVCDELEVCAFAGDSTHTLANERLH